MQIKQVAGGILLATFLFTTTVTGVNAQDVRISAKYMNIDSIHTTPHKGIDFAAPKGYPIQSFTDGVVVRVVDFGKTDFGKAVYIQDQYGRVMIYGHMSKWDVKEGQKVKFGDKIGEVGSTGRSTGNHLHFQVNIKGKPTDPSSVLNQAAIRNALLKSR